MNVFNNPKSVFRAHIPQTQKNKHILWIFLSLLLLGLEAFLYGIGSKEKEIPSFMEKEPPPFKNK